MQLGGRAAAATVNVRVEPIEAAVAGNLTGDEENEFDCRCAATNELDTVGLTSDEARPRHAATPQVMD